MTNDSAWADVFDAVWDVIDDYDPLTAWLEARGGQKYRYKAGDRFPLDLAKADLPALLMHLSEINLSWRSNAWQDNLLRFKLLLLTGPHDQRELLDFAWHVWRAIGTQRNGNFGLPYLLKWLMAGGQVELLHEKPSAYARGLAWQLTLNLELTLGKDPATG